MSRDALAAAPAACLEPAEHDRRIVLFDRRRYAASKMRFGVSDAAAESQCFSIEGNVFRSFSTFGNAWARTYGWSGFSRT